MGYESYLKAAPAVLSPAFFIGERMGLNQSVKPIAEPLTAAEAFPHLRLIPITAASSPDSGNNTQGDDFNNVTDPVSIVTTNYANIPFAVGRLLKIENEILEVVEVNGTAVKVARGRLESTAEAHADGADIFRGTDAENEVADLIIAARHEAERVSWRQLITATWILTMNRLPVGRRPLILPKPPLQASGVIVAYDDVNGDAQTFNAANYDVITEQEAGFLVPKYDQVWPAARLHPESVRVTFLAGYGVDASTVPQDIKSWIKMELGWLWQSRTAMVDRPLFAISQIRGLLDPVRDERIQEVLSL